MFTKDATVRRVRILTAVNAQFYTYLMFLESMFFNQVSKVLNMTGLSV